MYEELVKRLRESKNEQCYIGCFGNCGDCKIDAELEQAAHAIEDLNNNYQLELGTMKKEYKRAEKLSRRETPMKVTEIHVDEYYCPACGAENNCDQGRVQDTYCPVCGQRLLPQPPKEEWF